MNENYFQRLETYVEEIQKAVAASRSSMSPAIVRQIVEDVKDIKVKTNQIPVIQEQIRNITSHADKIDGVLTEVALNKQKIGRIDGTLDYVVKSVWGLVITAAGFIITAIIKLV